jgi:hypothetical protein
MILISHRGNLSGRNPERENNPEVVLYCLNLGYHVEIDVWCINDVWWLGHDEPQYKIEESFLDIPNLWLHCKNGGALKMLQKHVGVNYFWHQEDDYTIVSNGIVWVYPNKPLLHRSICCMPELGYTGSIENCYGICTDKIYEYEHYRSTGKGIKYQRV